MMHPVIESTKEPFCQGRSFTQPQVRFILSFFGDFHQSAQTITSRIVSNLAKPCAYHEVIEHYGGAAARDMGALLRHYSLDGNLYANAIRRINASPMPEISDKAVLLVMMFLITGCLANPEIAAKTTRSFMEKKLSFTFSTLQPALARPDHIAKCADKPTRLGLIRIDNEVVCSPIYPLSTSKEGTIIGLLATGSQNINDVDIDISRKHLRIFENGSAWYAQGLGSTNGTTLISGVDKSITVVEPRDSANKQYPPVKISHGDTLCLGKTTRFLVLKISDRLKQ